MGLFHKTLSDANELILKKEFGKAHAIVEQHLKYEHHFKGDLTQLTRLLNSYQVSLEELEHNLDSAANTGVSGGVHSARERADQDLHLIKQLLRKLLKEEKIKLK